MRKQLPEYVDVQCGFCGHVRPITRQHLLGATRRKCTKCVPRYKKHGLHKTAEYKTWSGIKERCHNPKCAGFPRYGGRGIAVCDRWRNSFELFLLDMGKRPPGMSIDRIDVNGNYEPSNCRWATAAQQQRNRRDNTLNIDLVNEIRGRFEHGERVASIARRVNVRAETVGRVCRGVTWKDEEPNTAERLRGSEP